MQRRGVILVAAVLAGCSPAPPEKPAAPEPVPAPPAVEVAPPSGPRIFELIPPAVVPGEWLTVRGEGFNTNPSLNWVMFETPDGYSLPDNHIPASSGTTNEIHVLVPAYANTPVVFVRVYGEKGSKETGVLPIEIMRPQVVRMFPTSAVPGQRLTVEIEGKYTHFAQGVTELSSDHPWVAVESCRVESPTRLRADLSVNPNSVLQAMHIKVATANEVVRYQPGLVVMMDQNPVVERVEYLRARTTVPALSGRAQSAYLIQVDGFRVTGGGFRPNLTQNEVACGGSRCVVLDASLTGLVALFPPGFTDGDLVVTVHGANSAEWVSRPAHIRIPVAGESEALFQATGADRPVTRSEIAVPAAGGGGAWPSLKLIGVMAGRGGSKGSAFINNRAVTAGEEIEGVRLLRVEQNGVVLEFNGQTQHLRIGQSTR